MENLVDAYGPELLDFSALYVRTRAILREHLRARLVMSSLPGVPPEATTYPGPPGYRDIHPPRGPAELKDRLEEIERGLWEVATGVPRPHIYHGRYRRVYAYFEAGAWLALQQRPRPGGFA